MPRESPQFVCRCCREPNNHPAARPSEHVDAQAGAEFAERFAQMGQTLFCRCYQSRSTRTKREAGMLRPCCAESFVAIGNSLILLGRAGNAAQHETHEKNEAKTARNPLFAALSAGALGEIRTPDPRIRSPM